MQKNWKDYVEPIRSHIYKNYHGMFREEGGALKWPFLTPGSESYADVLWDWDSWLSNIALRQIFADLNDSELQAKTVKYEQGCVLNFLSWCYGGWIPINIRRDSRFEDIKKTENLLLQNMHKPVLAQHAAFLIQQQGGDAEWLREHFFQLSRFISVYHNHNRHQNGLYYWQNDRAIGVDNDPCTYFRPPKSSGSIYLNCLMYKELEAMVYICNCLNQEEVGHTYRKDADNLKKSILDNCWDERDGFFYSVDLNLLPVQHIHEVTALHAGCPRDWDCLIQRIGVWSGFLAIWAGIATQDQARRMIEEHFRNTRTFNAPFGVRSLSKMEKMYNLRATGNPSNWLGPVWGISNYMTFRGLVKYGFYEDAKELAEKTVCLFGRDIVRFGALHEYYNSENGEPILNRGFENWNYLVLNMIAWLQERTVVSEF